MFLSVGLIVLLALVFGPSLWVKFVMKRYSSDRPEMPGTGGELAQHLIDRFELEGVKVEVTELGDHYDPMEKKVRLLREHFESKSLTAVAIAAHEVGHAIQDQQGDRRLVSRTKMIPVADRVARWSAAIISLSPVIALITRHPVPFSLVLLLGLSGFIARMMVHAVTLPIEFDASFSKALPVLSEGNYVSSKDEVAVTRILRAAALTYVSAALADVLNLGRWIAILLRR
tara:strand:+ start:486 stop:1172 length:687 start_codon:yes stop_codon:yes gene_type:complete